MASEQKRLIGEDGALFRGTLGTEVVGDGTTFSITAKTLVQITAIAGTANAFTGVRVGDFYYSPVVTDATDLPTGCKWKVLAQSNQLDLAGWNLENSADIVETTTLNDRFKRKRTAKLDATGSATVVFVKGITDDPSAGFLNSFFDVITVDNTGTATLSPVATEPFWIIGWLDNKDSVSGNHQLFTVFQAEFENFPLNVKMGETQGFDINFHLVGATDPVIYRIQNV